jgi:hypothetical protein
MNLNEKRKLAGIFSDYSARKSCFETLRDGKVCCVSIEYYEAGSDMPRKVFIKLAEREKLKAFINELAIAKDREYDEEAKIIDSKAEEIEVAEEIETTIKREVL